MTFPPTSPLGLSTPLLRAQFLLANARHERSTAMSHRNDHFLSLSLSLSLFKTTEQAFSHTTSQANSPSCRGCVSWARLNRQVCRSICLLHLVWSSEPFHQTTKQRAKLKLPHLQQHPDAIEIIESLSQACGVERSLWITILIMVAAMEGQVLI